MPERDRRRIFPQQLSMLVVGLWVGLIALGGVLIAWSGLGPSNAPGSSEAVNLDLANQPLWIADAPRRASFESELSEFVLDDFTVAALDSFDRWTSQLSQLRAFTLRAEARLSRTLAADHTLDSAVSLALDCDGSEADASIEVVREGHRFEQHVRLQRQQYVPIGFGDLQLRDAQALWAGLTASMFEPVGYLETNSSRLLVVAMQFDLAFMAAGILSNEVRPEALDQAAGRGASALVYLDTQRAQPTMVRVFDAAGRMVRSYSGFVFEQSGEELLPKAVQVTSVPNDSETTLVFDSLQLVRN